MKRVSFKRKNESLVEDPHELLLSLVDMGSLDVEDALLACVTEMSDAECKRVLNSLSLPECCDEVEDEVEDEIEETPADELDEVETLDDTVDLEDDSEPEIEVESEDDDAAEECRNRELEARIRRLERVFRRKRK